MIRYEIEQALRQKADMYEIHTLKSEIDKLKNANYDLEQKLTGLQNSISNIRETILGIIDTIQEENMDGFYYKLENLKSYL
jgi:predicted  nucleic acid-binding Zn-ribbon protein